MIYVIGDSFSNPGWGATSGHGYVAVFRRLAGNPALTNLGISGGQVADLTGNLCSINITGADKSIVELGTNDHWIYGPNATKLGYFFAGYQSVLAYLATPSKLLGKNTAAADLSGSWVNTPSFGIGKMGSAAGSSIKFRVSGTVVYLGGIQFEGVSGSFSVSIDGVDKGTFQVSAPGLTTQQNMPCGQRLYRFAGLPDGEHEVVMTMLGGQYVYAEWCAGNAQAAKPPVYVMPLTKYTAGAYAGRPPLSDVTIKQYNDEIRRAVGELVADGLDIRIVESDAIYFPDVDTYTDGVHPNDTGHAKLGMNLWRQTDWS